MLLNTRKKLNPFAHVFSPRIGVWLSTVVCLGLGAVASANAANLEWPGAAPCNTTLQACIDAAAAGDRVEIVQTALIDENIFFSKSLSLVGTTGFDGTTGAPVYYGQFAAGKYVYVSSLPPTGTVTIIIDGLVFNEGRVETQYTGSGTLDITVSNLLIRNQGLTSNRIAVQQTTGSTGTVNARIERNTLELEEGSQSFQGIEVYSQSSSGAFNVEIYENKIQALQRQEGSGIAVYLSEGATATTKIWANEVRGEFSGGAIKLDEGLSGSAPSNLTAHVYSNVLVGEKGSGIGFNLVNKSGTIDADFINNTVTNQNRGVAAGTYAGGAGGGIIGMHANNLIAYNSGFGIYLIIQDQSTINNQNNLLWANGSNSFIAHASTITANPQLIHKEHPWVRAGSPAIDAGDTPLGGLGAALAGIPYLAADGLRRQKGTDLDIGAYEYGDVSFRHTTSSANVDDNNSTIDHPSTTDNSSARIQATQQFDGGLVPENSYGLEQFLGKWRLFNQKPANSMLLGVPFAIFTPDNALGAFVHVAKTTPISNIFGWSTQVDNIATNSRPNDIVFVSQNWNAPGGGFVSNAHSVGVFYASGVAKWHITNLDQIPGQDMPHNAGFNVYAQAPSKNVFRLTANSRNRIVSSTIAIDHPLLNGNPCATPQVTRLEATTPLTGIFYLFYSPSFNRWAIQQRGPTLGLPNAIADGQQFHVLIDPRQIQECAGVMFADGFE